jgi:hypothetical protein
MLTLTSQSTREPVALQPARKADCMRILPRILLLVLFSFPLLCRAEENCLWLNAATAGGVLGGAVAVSVTHPNPHPLDIQPANVKSGTGPMSANPSGYSYAGNTVDDSDCAFHRQSPVVGELRIQVRTMSEPAKAFVTYTARCGAHGTPLKAIGNEALVCDLHKKGSRLSEQVVGRVRDRLFVIDLSVQDPLITQSVLREKAETTAEIVAGNLF